jgi:predicted RNase H-like HicB family nuclease
MTAGITRQVILYPGEESGWVVECPSLPGCLSQGATIDEALANIKEAIALWIEDAEAHGESVPDDHMLIKVVEL